MLFRRETTCSPLCQRQFLVVAAALGRIFSSGRWQISVLQKSATVLSKKKQKHFFDVILLILLIGMKISFCLAQTNRTGKNPGIDYNQTNMIAGAVWFQNHAVPPTFIHTSSLKDKKRMFLASALAPVASFRLLQCQTVLTDRDRWWAFQYLKPLKTSLHHNAQSFFNRSSARCWWIFVFPANGCQCCE